MADTAGTTGETFASGLLGLPLSHWAFACRVWIAMMIALAAAFWLQLDSASSAAVTVGILAQPQRGQAFRKAAFRFGATIVGLAASIVIAGIFGQSRDLFVLAYATWMAAAVYVASCYDGTRAYGAVLSGYTLAIMAVMQIDTPQDVFTGGVGRLATVALGIAAIALVDDVFAAPDVYPGVRARLLAARRETRVLLDAYLADRQPDAERAVTLIAAIVALRLDVQTLPSEAPSGAPRAAAANSASVAMIAAIDIARSFAAVSEALRDVPQDDIRLALRTDDLERLAVLSRAEIARSEVSPQRLVLLHAARELSTQCRIADGELDAMETARWPSRRVALPIHRDRQSAARLAIQVYVAIVGAGALLILSSWPMTSVAFSIVGILAGLGATTPDIRTFAKGALIGVPLAAVVAGITEFVLLDGRDAFPLLALGMAPGIVLACLLSLQPKTAGLGFLILIFQVVILSPANPQSYDERTFLLVSFLTAAGAAVFAFIIFAMPPIAAKQRRRWLVNAARADLIEAAAGQARRSAEAMRYLAADRLVQLSRLTIGAPAARVWRLGYLLTLSNLTTAAIRAHEALDRLVDSDTPGVNIGAARRALAAIDAAALNASATALAQAPHDDPATNAIRADAIAELAYIAGLSAARRPALRHLRSALSA